MPEALKDLEALTGQLEPPLRRFTNEKSAYLRDFLHLMGDWSVFSAPEILPNGDIILLKKHPAQAFVALSFIFCAAVESTKCPTWAAVFGLRMWWVAGWILPVAQPTSAVKNRHCQRKTDNKANSISPIGHAT